MLNHAHRLSSSSGLLAAECDNLTEIFLSTLRDSITVQSPDSLPQAVDIQVNKPVRIILPFKDQSDHPTYYEDSSPILRKKLRATCAQRLRARKLLNPNHLLLTNNALFVNIKVICATQIMWAIHADTYFSALMNISILSLVNTCGTHTI